MVLAIEAVGIGNVMVVSRAPLLCLPTFQILSPLLRSSKVFREDFVRKGQPKALVY